MSVVLRRHIPITILASMAFFMIGDTLLLEPTYNAYAASGRSVVSIIGSFAVMLSVTLFSRIHIRRIQRRRNVMVSSVLLICMWTTIAWGLYRFAFFGEKPSVEYIIQSVFAGIVSPGDATIYSILAFFIASAAYRAFRARSLEATVLLAAGLIVMLGNAPVGEAIWGGDSSL